MTRVTVDLPSGSHSESVVFRRTLVRAVIYPVVLLSLLIVVFLWQLDSMSRTNERVEHSNTVIAQASNVLKLIIDMETGLRGYLLTDDSRFLEPYHQAESVYNTSFSALQTLVTDNPAQTEILQTFDTSFNGWQQFAVDAIENHANAIVTDVETQLIGKQQMDTLRDQLASFVNAEARLRSERIQVTQSTLLFVVISVIVGGLVVGSLLAFMIRQQLINLSQTYEQALLLSRQQAKEILSQQDKLRQSNEQLQQFAYIASHDLQEPLRMITSYVQLLQKRYADQLDTDAKDFIGYAVDGAARMKELIAGLLQYSRLETGEQQPFILTSLEEVLDKTLINLSVAIAESGTVITHDNLPEVQVHPLQMTQLFQNLIGNAIKFRDQEPLKIHIGVTQHETEWQFGVRDNGIGIAPEYRERIFGMFQRLHTRAVYEGTGIGLAVCKKIVERHNGRIWVDSTVGNGATFYFTLPLKQPEAAKAGTPIP